MSDVAKALSTANGMAEGGGQRTLPLTGMPGAGAREAAFKGPLHTATPGRTDRHEINVASGSYVIPADIISAIGEGNTLAGMRVLEMIFPPAGAHSGKPRVKAGGGPTVMDGPSGGQGSPGPGGRHPGHEVPIIAAGGEYVLSPDQIMARFGDLDHGHESLDAFVKKVREEEIKRLKTAPPPKK